MKRKYVQLLIGILVSAFFLWLTLPSLHLQDVFTTLRTANYWWIIPGVAVYFVGLWVRSWRWHFMLRHLKPVPTRRLYPLVCIGYFGNNIYPFRAGEVIRSVMLKRKEGIAIPSSLATVFIERIFDGLTMLLFVFLALPFAPLPAGYREMVLVLTIAFVAVTAVFVWAAVQPERLARIYHFFSSRFLPQRARPAIDSAYERFMLGLQSLSSRYDVLMIFGTSVIIWLIETTKYWFVMHAFPFEVSFLALMLINGIVNLATTLPSAPGYIGTFDVPGIKILQAYGIGAEIAAGYIFALHVALWVPVTLVGGYYFVREHLSWNDLGAASDLKQNTEIADGAAGS